MKKAKGLNTFDPTIRHAANLKNQKTAGISVDVVEKEEYTPKSVNLKKSDWRLLRVAARARADRDGTRDSVSKVVESLIDASREALEAERKG